MSSLIDDHGLHCFFEQPHAHLYVLRGFLPDRQGALVERFRLAVAALGLVQQRQVVERCRARGMVGAERFLIDRQGALVERLRFAVAAERLYDKKV